MKNQKEEILERIHKLMRENGLTLDDVQRYSCRQTAAAKNEFDVLCVVQGRRQRLPFKDRGDYTVIGIFPFHDDPTYIELDEEEHKKHTDKDVDENRLLDVDFCERVAIVIKPLNECLRQLYSPILTDCYLADCGYMPHCGWIVKFIPEMNTTGSDYYGGNEPAKRRYVGKF